jgi:hypothetical protein
MAKLWSGWTVRDRVGDRRQWSNGYWHLAFAATRCNLSELSLTREGCRDFRRGDGSERAIGRHDTLSNRPRFFAGLNHPHSLMRVIA